MTKTETIIVSNSKVFTLDCLNGKEKNDMDTDIYKYCTSVESRQLQNKIALDCVNVRLEY